MSEKPTVNWTGASGKPYTYHIWELPANFNPNQNGNYIYTKIMNNQWVPIYIGQGDLKDRTENHHKAVCIRSKGATHIHVHLNSIEANRLAEEQDLLARYTNAYEPSGCNERIGG
ncbi:hypothetical protein GW814_01515 [Candidatus Falkowbacteria bacterium]|nr:hypothetical protein [Candidatus Falkowbacteria bacterium]